ncbi:MAG TPA: hypothetical protein ENI82_06730 [Bacteroidetes bacterium]|nr:hypothetical protein [Bacteroidota bacterium]
MSRKKKYEQKKEIEEKKKILKNEFGMEDFHSAGDLPPEIESQFLDHIMEFEKQFQKQNNTTVYKRIGSPDFIKPDKLQEKQLSEELDKITKLMNKNGIRLDTICEVEEKEIYRFITEELFDQEIEDINIPGMMATFIYEEFYPNHEYDIKEHTEDVLNYILKPDKEFWEYIPLERDNFISKDGNKIKEKELKKIIFNFKDSFSSFTLNKLEFIEVQFDLKQQKGSAEFRISYNAQSESGTENMKFEGKGHFNLKYEYEYWTVSGIEMPGLVI